MRIDIYHVFIKEYFRKQCKSQSENVSTANFKLKCMTIGVMTYSTDFVLTENIFLDEYCIIRGLSTNANNDVTTMSRLINV